jgi:GTP-binding protein HflX
VASFRATLEEARAADALLHVVDASHPDWEGQLRVVEKVLAELGLADRPVILVFNKIDAVPDAAGFTRRIRELHPGAVLSSTMRTDGLTPLKVRLRELERAGRVSVRVRVPLTDGGRLAELYREGEVLSREEGPDAYELVVRLEPWLLERLKAGGLEVVESTAERVRLRRASG